MKKRLLLVFSISVVLALSGCKKHASSSEFSSSSEIPNNTSATNIPSISVPDPTNVDEPTISGDFSLVNASNTSVTGVNNVYTITSAGTYTASGVLNGQIVINATDNDKVILVLNGLSISNNTDSPIKAINADNFTINVKDNTENLVKDLRNTKTVDNEAVGEGAINSKVDLKIKGSGLLVVEGNYNNGIHTSDDLEIQAATIKSTGYNNAFKGNDSVEISSGTLYAISKNGQGIKTKNSDISSKGNQRGDITINGGYIYVDSVYDALDASYNVNINETNASTPTVITIKTGDNATYKANYDKSSSAKGIKAENNININGGYITLAASDDAVHANYGETLENGSKGLGNVNIAGGTLLIASGDDAIHADNTLTISGGQTVISGSYEGLEANHIVISGGSTYVYGRDDGLNASKKINETPTIEVSGGFLDISVANGDTDAIDSNGSFTQTGGTIISRGSPGVRGSNMSTALDCDGTATISGGTFIAFNGMEKTPSLSNSVYKAATSNANSGGGGFPGGGPGGGPNGPRPYLALPDSYEAGDYKVSGEGIDISFSNNYQYGSFMIYSSLLKLNSAYTLTKDTNTLLSWTQSSSSVTIS